MGSPNHHPRKVAGVGFYDTRQPRRRTRPPTGPDVAAFTLYRRPDTSAPIADGGAPGRVHRIARDDTAKDRERDDGLEWAHAAEPWWDRVLCASARTEYLYASANKPECDESLTSLPY